jgi:acetate kinase
LHIPPTLDLIRETESQYPGVPQFACFDTAFHRTLPEVACHFPLPVELWNEGIFRYGFHGLSYEAIVSILGLRLRPRTVVAHLGNGCSLAALKDGISVDTTMGLTPTGGIPMSSRSGDLDPGVFIYLLRTRQAGADELEKMLNAQSGLLGLSGGESDFRALQQAAQKGSPAAALAIQVFARNVRKVIASYAAVLSGIDLLVFTGGIGENSPMARRLAVQGLEFMGMDIDEAANEHGEEVISAKRSTCEIRVVATDEDRQIARHTRQLLFA